MNHLIKILGLSILFFVLASCSQTGQNPTGQNPTGQPTDYDAKKQKDTDRDQTISNSKNRHKGSTCEDEDNKHDCRDICKDIYNRRNDRKDCEELTIAQIDRFEQVYKTLKDPDNDDLRDIDLDDLDVLINISIEPLDSEVKRYSNREAKNVLTWIAENSKVAELFKDEDGDFVILDQLLKRVTSFSSGDLSEPFITSIDSGDNLLDISISTNTDVATNYFQDYILDTQDTCEREKTSIECFTTFCKIGKDLNRVQRDNWLGNKKFVNYIDDVIEAGTNGASSPTSNQWDTDEISNEGDLNNWESDLCGGLT